MKHGGTSGAGSKVDSIREELEEAETKVEQCRVCTCTSVISLVAIGCKNSFLDIQTHGEFLYLYRYLYSRDSH